jgi:hypothetical protein
MTRQREKGIEKDVMREKRNRQDQDRQKWREKKRQRERYTHTLIQTTLGNTEDKRQRR